MILYYACYVVAAVAVAVPEPHLFLTEPCQTFFPVQSTHHPCCCLTAASSNYRTPHLLSATLQSGCLIVGIFLIYWSRMRACLCMCAGDSKSQVIVHVEFPSQFVVVVVVINSFSSLSFPSSSSSSALASSSSSATHMLLTNPKNQTSLQLLLLLLPQIDATLNHHHRHRPC